MLCLIVDHEVETQLHFLGGNKNAITFFLQETEIQLP